MEKIFLFLFFNLRWFYCHITTTKACSYLFMSCFSEIKSALTSSHGRSSLADTDVERAAMSSKRQREKQEVHDRSRIISSDCKHPFLRCLEPQILCTMPRSERACGFVWRTCLSHKTNKADSISDFSFQNKFPVTYKMTFFVYMLHITKYLY